MPVARYSNNHSYGNDNPSSGRYDSNFKIPHPRERLFSFQHPEGVRNDNHGHGNKGPPEGGTTTNTGNDNNHGNGHGEEHPQVWPRRVQGVPQVFAGQT